MRILTRYVLGEVLKTFSLALTVLTGIILLVFSFQALHKFNLLDFGFLLRILPSMAVGALALTLPFALLVGTVLTLGRLSADNEITALKACGVHPGRLIGPILVLGLGFSGVGFYLNDQVVPDSYIQRDEFIARALKSLLQSQLSAGATTIDFFDGYRVSYTGIAGGRFQNLTIHRLDGIRVSEEITAREGRLELDEERRRIRFILTDGSFCVVNEDPSRADEKQGTFGVAELDIDLPTEEKRKKIRARYLHSHEILSAIEDKEAERRREGEALAAAEAALASGTLDEMAASSARMEVDLRRHLLEDATEKSLELQTEYHLRFASCLASFLIVLLGAPLGILIRHSNKMVAFFVSFVTVMVVYYPLLMVGKGLAEDGVLPPVVAAWLANGTLGVLGLILLWRVLRR